MINNIYFNEFEMLKYYMGFDSIEKKYEIPLKEAEKEDKKEKWYEEFNRYEESYQFGELTRKQFGDIQENLNMIYADKQKTDIMLDVYDLVCQKVINQYLNIDGVERLFSDKYINFEWEMHLGMNYKKHEMDLYRDHFIHQVRVAFSMDIMLQNGFLKKIKRILGNEGDSKISRYVCKYINQQLEHVGRPMAKYGLDIEVEKEFYLENIIYFSSYMAGLFHDIGYPQCTNMKSGRNMREYIANVYHFGSGGCNFDKITSVLQNSLLFRVVSNQEIKDRIECERVDHGAVSALMFLLHFYENGAVYQLEPYKHCAVEIAALAIYNHTNKYSYIEGKEQLYERSVFSLNPISYLLRLCDDLQEWERIYFELSDRSNLILCNKCHTPLVRREKIMENIAEEYILYYECMCNNQNKMISDICIEREESGLFSSIFRRKNFPYRRMHNIVVCNQMILFYEEDTNKYTFELDYDLEKLLNINYISTSYAKKRIEEINMVKKLLVRQSDIGHVFLKYFVTSNIVLIKAQIINEYLYKCRGIEINVERLALDRIINSDLYDISLKSEKIHDILVKKAQDLYNEFNALKKIGGNENQKKRTKSYLKECFNLYIYLAITIEVGKFKNTLSDKKQRKAYDEVLLCLWENYKKSQIWSEEAGILIKDCCKQATRMYSELAELNEFRTNYMEQYEADDMVYVCVDKMTDSSQYVPLNRRTNMKLDAYTDLYWFKIILNEIRNTKEKSEC